MVPATTFTLIYFQGKEYYCLSQRNSGEFGWIENIWGGEFFKGYFHPATGRAVATWQRVYLSPKTRVRHIMHSERLQHSARSWCPSVGLLKATDGKMYIDGVDCRPQSTRPIELICAKIHKAAHVCHYQRSAVFYLNSSLFSRDITTPGARIFAASFRN